MCSLVEDTAGGEASVTNSRLRTLLDPGMQWLCAEEVKPETLPALPRNIAKNLMATFFQGRGRELVAHEGDRMKAQVRPLLCFYCFRFLKVVADNHFI